MNRARNISRRTFPTVVGIAAAGIVVGTGGFLTWRSGKNKRREVGDDDASSTPKMPKRTGPMVAVYLDKGSVQKLRREFPGTAPGRMRKVVMQYNPSDEERQAYQPYFGGLATVKLTGEAFSTNRRALVASIYHGENPIEPQSLPCAVDVTPGDAGGGPLGSVALIEQIKRAGAEKKVSWKGALPQLTAHGREFPSEEGGYDRLDEPFTLTGSVCRADWVEGTTGRCRTLAEGLPRTDGWAPQACILCNTLEASPCRDVYKRFDSVSERIAKLSPPGKSSQEESSGDTSREEDARGDVDTTEGAAEKAAVAANDSGKAAASLEDEDRTDDDAVSVGGKGERTRSDEEDKLRNQELETLEAEREGVALEMLICTDHHAVWLDSNADDGSPSDMMDDDDEEDGDDDGVRE